MINDRIFTFSSVYFGGYRVICDIRYFELIEDMIDFCKKNLLNTLENNNFIELIDIYNDINFHIHTHTFEEILIAKNTDIIYICECENNIN